VNVVIATYHDALLGDVQVFPENGTVAFGSSLHGWGFTLEVFGKMYASKLGIPKEDMTKRLWGDNFFNAREKKWTADGRAGLPRAFCQFIMDPIIQLVSAIMSDNKMYERMMGALDIELNDDEKALTGTALMQRVMQKWINAADNLLAMIVTKLPSPREAQKYRVQNLYEGPMDDAAAQGIRNCDPAGPLMMYVSKMVPTNDGEGRFYAFGRVFSGTIATGQKVRIQGPSYKPGSSGLDLFVKNIEKTVLMGSKIEQIQDVPCGNTVALVGVDQYIVKSGTITTLEDAHNIADMKYSVSPVMKVAVKAKDEKDLPKLVEGLKKLSKGDPLATCSIEESGEHIIAGCGELHLEICLKDLKEQYAKCDFTASDPVVSYRETVSEESNQTCLAKSPNEKNCIYLKAVPMGGDLIEAIEYGTVGPKADPKERAKILAEKFDWDQQVAETKIWCFGPEIGGANLLVDGTSNVQNLDQIKDSVNGSFQLVTKEGPLCEENMRGIRFNIMDVTLDTDAIHRGAGQIMPATRRCCLAAALTAKPVLQEPVFLVEIGCP